MVNSLLPSRSVYCLPRLYTRFLQARQNRLQLVDDLRLHRRIIDGGFVTRITGADGDVAVVIHPQDMRLPR